MASIYRDRRSPYWFLRYKDTTGKWRCKSLRPLRHGVAADTRKARLRCAEASLEERSRSPQRDLWEAWVPAYLQTRYATQAATRQRMIAAWDNLCDYLADHHIRSPQELVYRDCMDYLPWRKQKANHNTARLELICLKMLCDEAIRRGMIMRNPAAKLGIPKLRPKEKPELTDEHIAKIRVALKSEPDWMSHSFEVALHQGCRLSETALFRDDVHIDTGQLFFRRTKGDKPFSVPINPLLKPMLQELVRRKTKSGRIIDMPANPSSDFYRFFKKLGIPGATFHSTRVTVASRLARAGYPMAKSLRLLNHSSVLIHQVYLRLQPQDVSDAYAVLHIPLSESQDAPPARPEHS